MSTFQYPLVFSMALSLIATAHAQNKDPFDPNAFVAPTSYQSTFSDYHRYQDPDIASWKGANDEVGQSAGHNNHASPTPGNRSPQDPSEKDEGTVSKPMPDHSGMHKK